MRPTSLAAAAAVATALLAIPLVAQQSDLDYFRSIHPQEADVRKFIERAYTNILINAVDEATFDAARSKTVGQTFVDPNFGREWTFIYAGGEKILNSERNAWNSDQSMFSLTVGSFTDYYDFALFNGTTGAYIRTVRLNKPFTNITQVRWMPNDPAKMFYFHSNKMYTFDVNTLAIAEYQTFASFTSNTTDIAGGDGNDVAPNGDLLIGNKGPDCFVYNIPLKKVVRETAGVRTYLDPTVAFPTINLGQIDYALTFHDKIIEEDEDGGGTLLRDLNGNVLQTIYKRTPHLDLTYFKDTDGKLYPGFHVVYNPADATHYNNLGFPSVAGGGYFHGWDPDNPTQLKRFTMDTWTAATIASGGMYSANRYNGSTGMKSLDGPMLNSQPWQVRTGECFESAYYAAEATTPRRFAHHYIGYTATYTTSFQPEGWMSPNGDFAIIKVKNWGWYKVKLAGRMSKAAVDAYLNTGNTAPTISDIANQSISVSTSTGALAFTVGDAETSAGSLTVSGTSSNTTLVPNGNIVFGGSGANRTVTVTPVAGQTGTTTITVTVSDGELNANDTFTVTVTGSSVSLPYNDDFEDGNPSPWSSVAGTWDIITDGSKVYRQTNTTGDAWSTIGSGWTDQVFQTRMKVLSFNGTNRHVSVYTRWADTNNHYYMALRSNNTIELKKKVGGTVTTLQTVSYTVSTGTWYTVKLEAVGNQLKGYVNGVQQVSATDSDLASGGAAVGMYNASAVFDDVAITQSSNTAPTISDIANQTISEDGNTGALAFTVGDAETAAGSLTVSGSSSNTTLVPTANIVFGGSGANRTVTVTPAANESGTATITVTVSDGSLQSNDTFLLTVNAVNDTPTISDIANQTVNEDVSTGALSFTVGDVETSAGSLIVSGSSSNTTLVPTANIVFGGSGANRTVTVTPAANQSGTATITVTVSDGSAQSNDTFLLTVNAVNDAPTISDIGNQTITEDGATVPLAFTVGDVETAAGSLIVSGSSSNTTLVPNGNIVFGGSGANRTVTVTPAANQNGTATITVTVSDGSAQNSDDFLLTVSAVNDVPTISDIANQSIGMGTSTGALAFTIGDVETAASSLTVSGSSSNTTLVPTANIVFGGSAENRTVTVTPAAGQTGTATITVTVSDGSAQANDTFDVNVTGLALPYNDDFEDSDPAPWTSVAGTWDIVTDGSKVYRQTATTGDAWSTVGSGWTDQVVQTRLKVLSFNGTNRHVSVYARWADTNNHYYMALRSNNTIELKKKVAGTVTTLQVVSFTMSTNVWYTARLEVIGSQLRGYVDNVLQVSATDTSLASGGAALGMYNASAVFDDIAITSTPPPAVLLAEDFEDSVANGFTPSGGTWAIVTDGTKVYEQSSTAASDAWSIHSTSWTNQVLEVDVKPLAFNGSNRPVSIYTRWTDSNNHYYLALRSNNTIELKKKVAGTVTTLQVVSYTVTTGTWYTLKLECVGTSLKGYVNGVLQVSATDTDLTSGSVALGGYAASMRFEDLLVTDGP